MLQLQPLTDEFIYSELKDFYEHYYIGEWITYAVYAWGIIAFVALAALALYALEHNIKEKQKRYRIARKSIVSLGILTVVALGIYKLYMYRKEINNIENYRVVETRIMQIETDTFTHGGSSGSHNNRETEWLEYAHLDGIKDPIFINGEDDIEYFESGEEVYIVLNILDEPLQIYGKKTYEYQGAFLDVLS